jgi:hypothetical protein
VLIFERLLSVVVEGVVFKSRRTWQKNYSLSYTVIKDDLRFVCCVLPFTSSA